jgi:hypothetical protein
MLLSPLLGACMPDGGKRVIFKTSRQRLAEGFLLPATLLPIGPVMRAALDGNYSLLQGGLVMLVILLLFSWGSSRLAPRFGGEWVTPAERLRRYAVEAIATPRWLTAIYTAAMVVGTLFAIILVLSPLAEWRDRAGIGIVLSLMAALSAFSVFLMLRGRTELREAAVMDGPAPSGYLRREVLRVLPRIYATYFLAAIIATAIALQTPPAQRWPIFAAAAIIIVVVLRVLSPGRLMPEKLYAVSPTLGERMMTALACGGVLLAILMSGLPILEWWNRPALAATVIACLMTVIAIASLTLGALVHGLARLAERRDQSS